MERRAINLADPEFEPSDDDLHALSTEAFADVGRRHDEALARLQKEIAILRVQALAHLAGLPQGPR